MSDALTSSAPKTVCVDDEVPRGTFLPSFIRRRDQDLAAAKLLRFPRRGLCSTAPEADTRPHGAVKSARILNQIVSNCDYIGVRGTAKLERHFRTSLDVAIDSDPWINFTCITSGTQAERATDNQPSFLPSHARGRGRR